MFLFCLLPFFVIRPRCRTVLVQPEKSAFAVIEMGETKVLNHEY